MSTLCRAVHSGTAKVVPCRKYMWTLHRLGCGMPFDAARPKNLIVKLSAPSKEAAWHIMSKRFQNRIGQFEKKIRQSSPVSFHSFYNLKKVCKKFFFHVDAIALAAYAEQLSPHGKGAVCCFLPRGIVWTHLWGSKEAIKSSTIYWLHAALAVSVKKMGQQHAFVIPHIIFQFFVDGC